MSSSVRTFGRWQSHICRAAHDDVRWKGDTVWAGGGERVEMSLAGAPTEDGYHQTILGCSDSRGQSTMRTTLPPVLLLAFSRRRSDVVESSGSDYLGNIQVRV